MNGRRILVLVIVGILLNLPGYCLAGKKSSTSISISVASSYDSNILRYSEDDRNNFTDQTERYLTPVSTLDDIRNDFKINISHRFYLQPKLRSLISLTGNFAGYAVNSIKNFGWLSLSYYQDLSSTLRVAGNYFYDINYYIRDYTDDHTSSRQHCEFSMDQWKGEIRYRKTMLWDVTLLSRYKKYAYNKYFTEYDSDAWEIGGIGVYRPGDFRIEIGYSYTSSDNVGFKDETSGSAISTLDDSELGQGDYEEDEYSASIRYSFKVKKRNAYIQMGTTISNRYYTTDRLPEIDPMHNGRKDIVTITGLTADYSLTRSLDVQVEVEYQNRNSTGSDDIVERVKNYKRWGASVEFSYQLW